MDSLVFPIRSDRLSMTASVRGHVAHETTAFQTIDVVDTDVFGRALLLDGHIQLTEMDERAYHEALVQIPLMALPEARAALVVGGGDGGVVQSPRRSSRRRGHGRGSSRGPNSRGSRHIPFRG